MGEWLVPFAGRNQSYACTLNFLWRQESLYIMDNHRAAAWCWLQHKPNDWDSPDRQLTVLHIDAHYDTAGASGLSVDGQPQTGTLTLGEYLTAHIVDAGEEICVYRWDNYISLLQHHHPTFVAQWLFATHGIGEKPAFGYTAIDPKQLISRLAEMRAQGELFILNLDLDFFRSKDGDRYPERDRRPLFETIAALRDEGRLLVTTVCLSPECCGSWRSAEQLLQEFLGPMRVTFSLPSL